MSLPPLLRCSNRGVGSTAFEPGFARKKQWGSELTRGQWEKPHRSTSLPGYVNPLWRGLYYSTFRSRFGPDKLKNLDGEAFCTRCMIFRTEIAWSTGSSSRMTMNFRQRYLAAYRVVAPSNLACFVKKKPGFGLQERQAIQWSYPLNKL